MDADTATTAVVSLRMRQQATRRLQGFLQEGPASAPLPSQPPQRIVGPSPIWSPGGWRPAAAQSTDVLAFAPEGFDTVANVLGIAAFAFFSMWLYRVARKVAG